MTATHGFTRGGQRPAEYNSWHNAKARCYNKRDRKFKNYGGRGIKMCTRWLGPAGFKNFMDDMGKKPTAQHSLDRKDNNGDYSPTNCRWATPIQQANNKRNNTYPTVRLPPDLVQSLKEVAASQGLTIGEIVRAATACAVQSHHLCQKLRAA